MKKSMVAVLSLVMLAASVMAADRLAIAEPIAKGGVKAQDIEAVWGMLEASVDGGYELISRAALKSIMTEIGLTTSSDLMNLNSVQKAKLGEIKTVKYLLVPTVAALGSRLNLSMVVLDASTGEIDPDRRANETIDNLDEMADKLKDILNEMGLGREVRKRGKSAILAPIVKVSEAPSYLAEDFNVRLEEALLDAGIRLQNLQSVAKILAKNNIGNLYEVEPAMFVRIGELLRVDNMVQATISRFSFTVKEEYIQVTRTTVVRCIGNLEGNIRIISAQTGEIVASFPFHQKINYDDIDYTEDWDNEDYGKYLIERQLPIISQKVIGKLK